MKICRFLSAVAVITSAGLVYVWQQAELVESNYRLLKMDKQLTKLVDQNSILKYNVCQLKAPRRIEKRLLANHIKLGYTRPIVITQLDRNPVKENLSEERRKTTLLKRTKDFLMGIFALRSEVEAMSP